MGSNFPTIICVTSAHRKQGKTQLVMRIVEGLTKEGFEVGTIKHIGGKSNFDNPQVKDTTRHAEAGAKLIVAVTKSEMIAIDKKEKSSLDAAIRKFPKNFDFIIVEGFKKSTYPRFIIIDKAEEIRGLNETGQVLGLTGHIAQKREELDKLDKFYPVVKEEDTDALLTIVKNHRHYQIVATLPGENCGDCGFKDCEEMAANLLMKKVSFDKCPHMTAELTLTVDGNQIFVKDFVQNIIRKAIEGMLETLKGIPRTPREITIHIGYEKI
ncbi:MAG: molybdopterin-guanine dinucleotide biosynthesis protein B [Candidatus Helarchaeota archaeon]|nr:molybdopterin-guanine dinucleotide biosynthesis protein B [Candidatus Helarchaeota archaeon]